MPNCKNTDERYRIYDELFRDVNKPDGYSWQEIEVILGEKGIELSQQQFNKDIKHFIAVFYKGDEDILRKTRQGKKVYYTYEEKTLSINANKRTYETIQKLARIDGLGIDDLIESLCESVGITDTDESIISYDTAKKCDGLDFLLELYEKIVAENVVEIDFCADFAALETYTIHPYHLRRYNGRWFLFGWNEEKKHLYNIALDRIEDIRVRMDIDFQQPTTHNISFCGENDYYKDVVGVTKYEDKPIETIKIRFSEKSYNYVCTKPLHQSQKLDKKDNVAIIQVIPNYELDALILSFGSNAEVLSPESYRDHIKSIIEAQLKKYSE